MEERGNRTEESKMEQKKKEESGQKWSCSELIGKWAKRDEN